MSGTFCVAWGCSNRKRKGKSFHRFPKNEESRKQWIAQLQRNKFQVTEYSRICADHFEESWFDCTGQTACLIDSAVPTIFNFPAHLQELRTTKSELDNYTKKLKKIERELERLRAEHQRQTEKQSKWIEALHGMLSELIDAKMSLELEVACYEMLLGNRILSGQLEEQTNSIESCSATNLTDINGQSN